MTPTTRSRRGAVRFAACWLALAISLPAFADDPVEPGPDVDAGLSPGTPRPLWELGLGVAGLSLPDYRGSDRSRFYALPLPYIVYRGTWLKADRDGARALLFESQRVKVDVSVAGSTPARSSENNARQGMPDLKGTFEIGPNFNVMLAGSREKRWKLDLRLPVRGAVTIERSPKFVGSTFSPNLNLDLAGLGGGWNLGALTGPVFADRKFHAYYYGVDPSYAIAGRPTYVAHGGYAGWRAVAATSRRFGNAWVGAFVRYDNLNGAAFDDSPLVRRSSSFTFGFGVSWVLLTSSERVVASD